jgi:hypothetical protein
MGHWPRVVGGAEKRRDWTAGRAKLKMTSMKLLLILLLWALLLVLCWPLALLLLIAWPFLWLLSIPFRIVGVVMAALVALVKALLFLPARLLDQK